MVAGACVSGEEARGPASTSASGTRADAGLVQNRPGSHRGEVSSAIVCRAIAGRCGPRITLRRGSSSLRYAKLMLCYHQTGGGVLTTRSRPQRPEMLYWRGTHPKHAAFCVRERIRRTDATMLKCRQAPGMRSLLASRDRNRAHQARALALLDRIIAWNHMPAHAEAVLLGIARIKLGAQ